MELKPLQVWILVLLGIFLIATIYLASGLVPGGRNANRKTEESVWLPPAILGTPTPTDRATGWWSNPPTPQTMKTWELTPTLTQTKNP
jgi:hypothetical protein